MPDPKEIEGEEEVDEKDAEIAKLKEDAENLKKKNSEYEGMVLSEDYLQFLATRGRQREEELPPEETKQPLTEADLEGMSKGELIEVITGIVMEGVRNEIKPLKETVTKTATTVVQDKFTQDVQRAADKYEDYWNFKDVMIQVAKAHPTLNAEQVYKLAGGSGKLKTKSSGEEEPQIINRPKVRSGALPNAPGPVSKKFTPASTVEAAGKAYDSIFGKEE